MMHESELKTWQEIKGQPGYYWRIEKGSKPYVIKVDENGDYFMTGFEQEFMFTPEEDSQARFVKVWMPDVEKLWEEEQRVATLKFIRTNELSKFPEKVEGYWRSHEVTPTFIGEGANMKNYIARKDAGLPWPVVWEIPQFNKQEFINRLADLEDQFAKSERYRGPSMCRLTGLNRGCAEYSHNGWTWPEGFIEYVRLGVPPSRAFYAFVMNVSEEDCKYLPTYNRE